MGLPNMPAGKAVRPRPDTAPVQQAITPEAPKLAFTAGQSGAQVTGGGADSRPAQAMALVAELLRQNKLVIKVQTFPFARAADAYRISQGGHVRGKLVLIP